MAAVPPAFDGAWRVLLASCVTWRQETLPSRLSWMHRRLKTDSTLGQDVEGSDPVDAPPLRRT
ncbi:hypothetical protein EV652_10661 [Kribbella steppae]|uniref:Uncharacterized protein n=1 Tax=Kribbella steppae TaxID=2512223 RepID=A0A4R2HGR9_9ACTN|nr:hypothetical protein EV652_10661 [Kribbella steppae]